MAHIPWYRDAHRAGRFPADQVRSLADLPRLPVLDKEIVRSRPRSLLADDCDPGGMYRESTSGTTGKPLTLWWSHSTHQAWFAVFEQRLRHWNGVSRHDRWATLGGQLVVPQGREKPPFWVWNAPGKQLYMSSYHLAPRFLSSYLDEIERRGIRYLFGYASSLDALATHALATRRTDVKLDVVFSNAEPFFAHQRRRIEQAFGCPTRDSYGMAEIAAAAFECTHGRLHISPDVGIVEVLRDDGTVAAPGEMGDAVYTGLLNRDQALIRYRQGDRLSLAAPEEMCACGVAMPLVKEIEGRSDDVLVTPDGRRVGRLDPVFKTDLGIREAQIAQVAPDHVEIRVVPGDEYTDDDGRIMKERLVDRMGDVRVSVVLVDSIARSARGKFRAVVNECPPVS